MFLAPNASGLASAYPRSNLEVRCGGPETTIYIPPPPFPAGTALYEQQKQQRRHEVEEGLAVPSDDGDAASALIASTAHRIWPSARLLANAMHGTLSVAGSSVLELGAGCGLPGLSAWKAGASKVFLTGL